MEREARFKGKFYFLIIQFFLVVVFIGMITFPLYAQENDLCMDCHGDKDLTGKNAKGKEISMYIDIDRFNNSVHGDLSCIDCHTDLEGMEDEHPEELKPVNCRKCHEESYKDYKKSVHAKPGGGGASCKDCHGYHYIVPNDNFDSPVFIMNIEKTCDKCHADVAFVQEHAGIPNRILPGIIYKNSVHGRAVAEGRPDAATCNDCHGSHDIEGPNSPTSKIYRLNVSKTCGQCHPKIQEEYDESVHGVAAKQGIGDSPVCTDCHGIHSIKSPIDPKSSVAEQRIAKTTCPRCHAAERINDEYAISTARVKTYRGTFHGLANIGGEIKSANCASCHGVHDIRRSSDPKSSINKKNLVKTCGKCHPGASEKFANIPVHFAPSLAPKSTGEIVIKIVRIFYIFFIIFLIGLMFLHNLIDFLHKLIIKAREKGPYFLRWSIDERVQHALLGITFIILVISGFALKYSGAWWVKPIIKLEGGMAIRAIVHRVAGVIQILLGLYHLYYISYTKRGREHLKALIPTFKDIKDAIKMVKYNLGLSKEKPVFGKYNYVEKMEYIGVIWGTIIMAATGFILWFEKEAALILPQWGFILARTIHFYEAVLATLTIAVWHMYSVVFNPDIYPMNFVKITGKLTKHEMEEEHGLEFEKMKKEGKIKE